VQFVLSAVVVALLLRIGGVEVNPGPGGTTKFGFITDSTVNLAFLPDFKYSSERLKELFHNKPPLRAVRKTIFQHFLWLPGYARHHTVHYDYYDKSSCCSSYQHSTQDLPVWFQHNISHHQLPLTTANSRINAVDYQPAFPIRTIYSSRSRRQQLRRKSICDRVLIPVNLTLSDTSDQIQLPKIYVLNATSLAKPTALQKLYCDLINYNIDVCVITETWFKHKHDVCFTSLAGYTLFRRDREGRKGGGVAIYVRHSLCSKLFPHQVTRKDIEITWVEISSFTQHFIIGAIYHPPRPKYSDTDLLLEIEHSLANITNVSRNSVILLCGDFNQLSDSSIQQLGLQPLNIGPTHAGHFLDRIYCSEYLSYHCSVVNSLIETKHKAVIASPDSPAHINSHSNKIKTQVQYRSHSPNQNAALLSYLKEHNWEELLNTDDLQKGFDLFYATAKDLLDFFFPLSTITVSDHDPSFITPYTKKLLRKRNKLMRMGKIEHAEAIRKRISKCISFHCKTSCHNLQRGSKQMWDRVREIRGNKSNRSTTLCVNISDLNKHFASISTDLNYITPCVKASTLPKDHTYLTEYEVFNMLDKIRQTATGLDLLPAWFIRTAAPFFSLPLAHLFNLSISQSRVPRQWKVSSITPIPKLTKPQNCQDYRPISITPVLSRVLEKFIVRSFLYPVITDPVFSKTISDQFAFRPTGSTTAALITLLQHLTDLVSEYGYVHLIALDFSKAFDTVRHSSLLSKVAGLQIDDQLYNWLVDFFSNRQHLTKHNQEISASLSINSSVIQGSGMGPVMYIINASDLHPICPLNIILKYADDTYLIVPSVNSHLIHSEMQHIGFWAESNNLKLNVSKSAEIIFTSPHYKESKLPIPPPIPTITRLDRITVLGVVLNSTFKFSEHVEFLLSKVSKTMFALRTLRAHGMADFLLHDVTKATLISQLTYASPAWSGFLSITDNNRLQSVIKKAKRFGYLPSSFPNFGELCADADENLFSAVRYNPQHVLHTLLPSVKTPTYNLRPRSHNFTLPGNLTTLGSKNFLNRMLFANAY